MRDLTPKVIDTLEKALGDKDSRVRLEASRIILERGWGKVPDAPKPGDEAQLIDGEIVPIKRVMFSNAPTPQAVEEWAAKHSKPTEPPEAEMVERFGIAPPPAQAMSQPCRMEQFVAVGNPWKCLVSVVRQRRDMNRPDRC